MRLINAAFSGLGPVSRKTFQAHNAIFSSSVSKNREVCTPETSCIKGTSLHIKNT